MNSGRARLRAGLIKTISFTITGIGSGTGAQAKPVIMGPMKRIAAGGSWAWIIPQKQDLPVGDMHSRTTGRRRIRRSPVLNLGQKKPLPGRAGVVINSRWKDRAGALLFMETKEPW